MMVKTCCKIGLFEDCHNWLVLKSKMNLFLREVQTPLAQGHYSMSASHLGNTPLNVAKLRDVIRKRLPELLDTVCCAPIANHV
jgi:hypothetical protein